MRKIKNQNLAELLVQLRFAPAKQRNKQLEAAEKLLGLIDKEKEYPFEFVCFQITGFRPKEPQQEQLIKGRELAGDLQIFITKLSGHLARPVTEYSQQVYDIEGLASVFEVSTKTIHRWRKRGLIARKFIFEDGKRRLGFLQSAVDEFLGRNPGLVARAGHFTRLTEKEKRLIIKQASALAAKGTMSRYQIIEKVAKQIGKVHETVRYTILNYEKSHPNKPVFGRGGGVIGPAGAAEIYKLFGQGVGVKELMRRFGRSKSSIYRIINQRRAKALLAKKIEFVPSEEFLQKGASQKILSMPLEGLEPSIARGNGPFELAGESFLPEYLQIVRDTPVLNREKEVELFRRYNFLKYLVSAARGKIDLSLISSLELKKIEDYLAEAEAIKKMIIAANLRLVVSIANKHTRSGTSLPELVSKGNLSLVKAVEEFDYTRAVRFGRCASWAIAKDYAQKIPFEGTRAGKAAMYSLANVQRDLKAAGPVMAAGQHAHRSLVPAIRDQLDEREQFIILNHFGLVGSSIKKQKKTLKQIGDELGLSKERVRQIELIALQKLRQLLSIEEFEMLTG